MQPEPFSNAVSQRRAKAALFLLRRGDEIVAEACLRERAVWRCRTMAELSEGLHDEQTGLVICDLQDRTGSALSQLTRLEEARQWPPMVVCCGLKPADAVDIVTLARLGLDIRPVIRDQAGYAASLCEAIRRAGEPWPDSSILACLDPGMQPFLLQVLSAIVVLGRTRIPVSAVGQACKTSERTIERHLAEAALPSARSLLGKCLALHSAWRLEVLDQPTKEVAAISGFDNASAFGAYLRRHVGATPGELRHRGSFSRLLGLLLRQIGPPLIR